MAKRLLAGICLDSLFRTRHAADFLLSFFFTFLRTDFPGESPLGPGNECPVRFGTLAAASNTERQQTKFPGRWKYQLLSSLLGQSSDCQAFPSRRSTEGTALWKVNTPVSAGSALVRYDRQRHFLSFLKGIHQWHYKGET